MSIDRAIVHVCMYVPTFIDFIVAPWQIYMHTLPFFLEYFQSLLITVTAQPLDSLTTSCTFGIRPVGGFKYVKPQNDAGAHSLPCPSVLAFAPPPSAPRVSAALRGRQGRQGRALRRRSSPLLRWPAQPSRTKDSASTHSALLPYDCTWHGNLGTTRENTRRTLYLVMCLVR